MKLGGGTSTINGNNVEEIRGALNKRIRTGKAIFIIVNSYGERANSDICSFENKVSHGQPLFCSWACIRKTVSI